MQHVDMMKISKKTKYASTNSAHDCQNTFSFKTVSPPDPLTPLDGSAGGGRLSPQADIRGLLLSPPWLSSFRASGSASARCMVKYKGKTFANCFTAVDFLALSRE